MLELTVHDGDKNVALQFEHSLLSLSKWESNHRKPFMVNTAKTHTEMLDYFQDMLMSPKVDPALVYRLAPEDLDRLSNYINESLTASSVPSDGSQRSAVEVTTSELIYYWMVELGIPFQPTETWHLSRLMMLINITSFKRSPEKKRSKSELLTSWQDLNEKRKKMFNSNG